jgi:pimeloyl-ACP methyl ester carboxylesterase
MQSLTTETITIPTNGIRLHAQAAGPVDGPLVILLHGFPEFWWGWRRQIGPLAEAGLRVIAPDQRGYNLSARPSRVSAYRISELAKDVVGISDHFGREKACVVGHDWGAAVAWYTAGQHPERVAKLAVLNVPHQAAMNRALRKPIWRQLLKSWYIFFFQIPRLPEWSLRRQGYRPLWNTFLRSSRPGTFAAEDFARYREAWSQPGGLTHAIHWYRAMVRMGLQMGFHRGQEHFARRVTAPTLILWGDRDAFLEPVLADWSREYVADGQVVHFPHASHWLQHEEAPEVNRRLIAFLS